MCVRLLDLVVISNSALRISHEHFKAIDASAHQHTGHHSWFSVQNEVIYLTDMTSTRTPLRFLGILMLQPGILASCSHLLYAKRDQACQTLKKSEFRCCI